MFKEINDFDKIKKELDNLSYLYEGDNNTTILKTSKNSYSIKKEDLDTIKLIFEIEGYKYKVIPFKYLKYSKILNKYAYKNEIWAFQIFVPDEAPIHLYDFNKNKIDQEHSWDDEILTAARDFKFILHLNEKPGCWGAYSNGLN